jgi:hypothetical protein
MNVQGQYMWIFEFLSSFQNHEQKEAINEFLSC